MRLRVLLPDRILFDGKVAKVVAESTTGSRGFLPRHIDYVAPLRQGILVATFSGGEERYFAHDRGLLVKKGDAITVTTIRAVTSARLEGLPELVRAAKAHEQELARTSRAAHVQLEMKLVKEFLELVR